MPKRTVKKAVKATKKPVEVVQTAAELHEAARVARRGGDAVESARLVESARAAERVEASAA